MTHALIVYVMRFSLFRLIQKAMTEIHI